LEHVGDAPGTEKPSSGLSNLRRLDEQHDGSAATLLGYLEKVWKLV